MTEEAELQPLPTDYVDLEPGDALLLYTDGLSDARDAAGRFYEDARLEQALEELRDRPAEQLLQGLLDDAASSPGTPRPTTSPSCWCDARRNHTPGDPRHQPRQRQDTPALGKPRRYLHAAAPAAETTAETL